MELFMNKRSCIILSAVLMILLNAGCELTGRIGSQDSLVMRYAAPRGEGALPISEDFKVFVNELPVDVYQVRVLKPHAWAGDVGPQEYEHASMAYFDFQGKINVRIKADDTIEKVDIRPLRYGIEPTVKGSAIEFALDKPRKLSIEINDDITHNLQLFTNPIEKNIPDPNDPKVRYFGPGMHFPADDGIPGAIKLESNETIYIAGGAIVHGSVETPFHEKVHDITVRGRGILLGQRDTKFKRGLMKIGFHCERVDIITAPIVT